METTTNKNGLFRLLGAAFFIQALMPLIAGLVFKSFESKENIRITMVNLANNITTVYGTVLLWVLTAVVIIDCDLTPIFRSSFIVPIAG